MYNNILSFIEMTRMGGQVKRYHCIRTVVQDSIASHSFGVAMFILALSPSPRGELIKAGLFHDLAEQVTGDSPAIAKWNHHPLYVALGEMETEFNKKWEIDVELSEEEMLVLAYADVLDLCYFCLEEIAMGNRNIRPVFKAGLKRIKSLPYLESAERFVRKLEVDGYGI